MQEGDKVIINPNIPEGAWSKYQYGFHVTTMLKSGVFTLGKEHERGGFLIGDKVYDEEWLLPVPLFKVGDKVKIRENLEVGDEVPYSVAEEMEAVAGSIYTVEEVSFDDRKVDMLGDDGYRYILKEDEEYSWSSPMFDLTNYKQLKKLNNESRLQEQESPLRGGSREIKCGICCRKHKPRVTVKSVSYKEVLGRG